MKKPNLLFIFTDEQRADTLAAYGNTQIHMPNLNKLAAESTVFERTYVTQAVCTPSRATIMTGLYPHTHGATENNVPLPVDVPCLPELLDDDDYVTAYHGKWHLGDEIFAQHGFDEWVSVEDFYAEYFSEGRDRSARSDYHHYLIKNGFEPRNGNLFTRPEACKLNEEFGKPAFLAREASRFIRENQENPFILYVNFLEPHMPFFGPRDNQYDPSEISLPENFGTRLTPAQPLKTRLFENLYYEQGHSGLPLKTEDDWRRMIANYWGLCSLVDTHVGTILDTLSECGLDDNTIVVYTSDHGDMMGSHRLIAKCVQFEEAVKVTFLVRLPGQKEGGRFEAPVSQVDIVPTLLDLMGQSLPEQLEGESLRPILEGRDDTRLEQDVFIEWNGPNNGYDLAHGKVSVTDEMTALATAEEVEAATTDPIRTIITPDGWKFNCSPLGEHELYNLGEDPLETTNLAGKNEYRPLMQDLTGRIRKWQEKTGDEVQLPL
ncbi:sulfatase-like hydrolase/transferase [Candidatus Hydrogenedentota bacterium]